MESEFFIRLLADLSGSYMYVHETAIMQGLEFILLPFYFLLKMIPFSWHYAEKPGKASIKSSASVIQATLITIRWSTPADDGGSPITGYRITLKKGETEIEKNNITNPGTTF